MNIFILDEDVKTCAQYHCDKHVVKMVLETAQLLSSAHRLLDGNERGDELGLYKVTHVNHPCSIWVRTSSANYAWAHKLLQQLVEEYTRRYGRVHKVESSGLLGALSVPPRRLPKGELSKFPQAMPEQYRSTDPVSAYRSYYVAEKARFARWKLGNQPEWFQVLPT